MKREDFQKMFELVEDKYIEEAMDPPAKGLKLRFIIGVTACFTLFICCGTFLINLRNQAVESGNKGVRITASDIDKNSSLTPMLGGTVGITAYFTRYAQNIEDIMVSPIRDNQDVSALRMYQPKEIDNVEACFEDKVNIFKNRLSELGIQSQEQEQDIRVKGLKNVDGTAVLFKDVFTNDDYSYNSSDLVATNFRLNITTNNTWGAVETNYRVWDSEPGLGGLALFGDEIVISENDSDEEISNSLTDVLKFANSLFHKNCKIQSITRDYEYGKMISVNAYEDSESIDEAMYNQYFSQFEFLYMDDNEGGEIKLIGIYYTEYEMDEDFDEEVNLISVKQAEEYLKDGYIFLGHVCPVCMSGNEEVDFSDYDGIEVVYRPDYVSKYMIPFYAFYKQIGDTQYAVTYVPAVKVDGLEEYFKEQEAWHVK